VKFRLDPFSLNGVSLENSTTYVGGGSSGIRSIVAGSNITVNNTDPQNPIVSSTGGGSASPLTTKGDLYTYSTLDTRLPVGADGTVLAADSAQTTGLKWIAAGGTGTVTNVSSTSADLTVANPTTTPALTVVSAPKLATARTIGTTTGDVTSAGSSFDGAANNTNTLTLATVNSNVGSFGSATQVPTYTVNGKGLTTAAANVNIQIAESQVTSLVSDLALKAPLASPTFTGTVTVPTPSGATDASTKGYVDSVAQGLSAKGSVLLATAAALPTNTYLANVITITATGTLTVDGTVTSLNDRILVKDEVSQLKNGVYTVTTAGAVGVAAILARSSDMDVAAEFPGAFVFVESGTVNAAAGFVCTNSTPPTVGTTAITFTQFSGAGEITVGSGLTKSGNTLDRNALTGDVAASAGSNTTTLATVNSNVGSFTNASVTVNGKGLITAASNGTAGTVTNTGGSLTPNSVVLGAGTGDVKVVAGITTNGTSQLNLGVAGSSVGGVVFSNATSGTITLAPVTGALGTIALSLPATTDTLVGKTTTDTLTNKTLTKPVIGGGTIAPGEPAGRIQYTTTGGSSMTISDGTNEHIFATSDNTLTLSGKTLTAPKIVSGGFIADANGNEEIIFTTTASAVNELTFANSATLTPPSITASGGDTNISINMVPKGSGSLLENNVRVATANNTLGLSNKDLTSSTNTFPNGNLGYAQNTSGFSTASSTPVQVTSLSVTVTAPGGRDLEITVNANSIYNATANRYVIISLWDGTVGSGTQINQATFLNTVANQETPLGMTTRVSAPAAGSKTYNVGIAATGGAGTANISGASALPAYIWVKVV